MEADLTVFGTLNLIELAWLLSNVFGLVMAVLAAAEAHMDVEAVRILGQRGTIAGADVRQRLLKGSGNRRGEAVKVLAHGLLLAVGIVVAASPTPRVAYEAFTSVWSSLAITAVALLLTLDSVASLRDRRTLWSFFEEDADVAATIKHMERPSSAHEQDREEES